MWNVYEYGEHIKYFFTLAIFMSTRNDLINFYFDLPTLDQSNSLESIFLEWENWKPPPQLPDLQKENFDSYSCEVEYNDLLQTIQNTSELDDECYQQVFKFYIRFIYAIDTSKMKPDQCLLFALDKLNKLSQWKSSKDKILFVLYKIKPYLSIRFVPPPPEQQLQENRQMYQAYRQRNPAPLKEYRFSYKPSFFVSKNRFESLKEKTFDIENESPKYNKPDIYFKEKNNMKRKLPEMEQLIKLIYPFCDILNSKINGVLDEKEVQTIKSGIDCIRNNIENIAFVSNDFKSRIITLHDSIMKRPVIPLQEITRLLDLMKDLLNYLEN